MDRVQVPSLDTALAKKGRAGAEKRSHRELVASVGEMLALTVMDAPAACMSCLGSVHNEGRILEQVAYRLYPRPSGVIVPIQYSTRSH